MRRKFLGKAVATLVIAHGHRLQAGLIIGYYEPCPFTLRKGMLHRFNFVNFSKGRYQGR